MSKSNKVYAMLALLGAVVFWGSAFPSASYLVNRYSLWTIMWFRMIIASAAFLLVPRRHLHGKYQKGDWKKLLPMMVSMPCMYFLCETLSLQYTSSVQAGVISGALPLFIAIGAAMFLKERIGIPQIGGLIISVAGVVLMTMLNKEVPPGKNPLLGNSLELLAMVFAGANMLLLKSLYKRYSPARLTQLQCLAGLVFFIPGIRGAADLFQSATPFLDLSLLFFLGIACSFAAFMLYNWAQSQIKASSAAVSINLVPVVAMLLGGIFLNEHLNGPQLAAAAAVLAGVMISQLEKKPRQIKAKQWS